MAKEPIDYSKLTKTDAKTQASMNRAKYRYERTVSRYENHTVGKTVFSLFGGLVLLLVVISTFHRLQIGAGTQPMYFASFLEMIQNAPAVDMSWIHLRKDWLGGWDPSFMPGLYNFVSALVGILELVAIVCAGAYQLCQYAVYFVGWLFVV